MNIHQLLEVHNGWLDTETPEEDIIIASLGRLVRSLPHHPFPGWSTKEGRQEVLDILRPAVKAQRGWKSAFHCDLPSLSKDKRRLLLERKLISPCMAARNEGCEILIHPKLHTSIMLNEEEHLVIHHFQPAYQATHIQTQLEKLANGIESLCPFAQNEQGDYLSSIPEECGTGLQIFIVLHLPGLVMSNLMPEIKRALDKLDLQMSPLYGDGNNDTGDLFVLSFAPCKQRVYQKNLKRLESVANKLAQRELEIREKLAHIKPLELQDQIGRALGRLLFATLLTFTEMANALSLVTLGSYYGLIHWDEESHGFIISLLRTAHYALAPGNITDILQKQGADADATEKMLSRTLAVQDLIRSHRPFLSHKITRYQF